MKSRAGFPKNRRRPATIPTKRVSSTEEFVNAVRQIQRSWGPSAYQAQEVWFRGVSERRFELLPSAYREQNARMENAGSLAWFETIGFADPRQRPTNEWEWYFAAQHFGLPTRLLDWTESALVALYFAVEPDVCREDPSIREIERHVSREKSLPATFTDGSSTVWMLDASWLNKQFFDDDSIVVPKGKFSSKWLPSAVKPGKPTRFTHDGRQYTNKYPLAIMPHRTTSRIIAQLGTFTVHGASREPLNSLILRRGGIPHLACVVIDDSKRFTIFMDLHSIVGLSNHGLFPEPDRAAAYIRRNLR